MYKLELKLQSLTLKEYALANGAKLSVGRHPASEIVLDDMAVSRHHATIEVQGQKLLVFDQSSKAILSGLARSLPSKSTFPHQSKEKQR
jgi:pSer/pThr/pTyr-binding forkhead associated (FHA) protein